MENNKRDCRFDLRVRLSALVQVELAHAPNLHPTRAGQPIVIYVVAESIVKVLPPCCPASPYRLAPALARNAPLTCISASTNSRLNLTSASQGISRSFVMPDAESETGAPMGGIYPTHAVIPAGSANGGLSIGGLYPTTCFVVHVSAPDTARVGDVLDTRVTVRVVGKSHHDPLHVRAMLLQRTFFGSDEPRARRAITNELFASINGSGMGEVTAHVAPSRRNAFYPSTLVGALRIEHVVCAQIFKKGALCGLAEARICLLPSKPSRETYRAQNPSPLPNWCTGAERRYRCPVQVVELAEGQDEDVCIICLDSLHSLPATKLVRCGHFGHVECMGEWFDCKPVCPTCNSPITELHAT
jgi:Ring finger domain